MAIRHLFAGALLLAWALPAEQGDRIEARRSSPASSSSLLFLLGHGSLAWAQQTVPAGVAALLVGSIPIWMALLDRVVFGKRLRSSAYVGFVLGFVGLAFLFDPFGEGHVDRVGALVIVFGALAWSARSSTRARLRSQAAARLGGPERALRRDLPPPRRLHRGRELGEATGRPTRCSPSPT